jgi:hypothetical protein
LVELEISEKIIDNFSEQYRTALVKDHVGILDNEEADKLAKAGGNSTAVLGSGLTAKSVNVIVYSGT